MPNKSLHLFSVEFFPYHRPSSRPLPCGKRGLPIPRHLSRVEEKTPLPVRALSSWNLLRVLNPAKEVSGTANSCSLLYLFLQDELCTSVYSILRVASDLWVYRQYNCRWRLCSLDATYNCGKKLSQINYPERLYCNYIFQTAFLKYFTFGTSICPKWGGTESKHQRLQVFGVTCTPVIEVTVLSSFFVIPYGRFVTCDVVSDSTSVTSLSCTGYVL